MEDNAISLITGERECNYKGRQYKAREDGAILRLPKEGSKPSKWDNVWTFGRMDPNTGYLLIGQERVHRIVCTAFHGEPEGDRNVVDHKDTNRQNNRPENLHWVTRLENVLNNPITRAKIELICGSIEAFIANPSLLQGHESKDPNFGWMHRVTPAEAEASYKRWLEWSKKSREERMPKGKGVGEFIYTDPEQDFARSWNGGRLIPEGSSWPQQREEIEAANQRFHEEQYGLKDSLTPGAKQFKWKTPTEFLLCPKEDLPHNSLQTYLQNLVKGKVFTRTKYGDGGVVLDCGYNPQDDAIYVLTFIEKDNETPTEKPWALCKITLQDGYYIHENQGSFFEEDGGKKYFTLAMGREWTSGDVVDDFC